MYSRRTSRRIHTPIRSTSPCVKSRQAMLVISCRIESLPFLDLCRRCARTYTSIPRHMHLSGYIHIFPPVCLSIYLLVLFIYSPTCSFIHLVFPRRRQYSALHQDQRPKTERDIVSMSAAMNTVQIRVCTRLSVGYEYGDRYEYKYEYEYEHIAECRVQRSQNRDSENIK